MYLKDLDDKRRDLRVLLLQTPSPKLTVLLEDKIKRRYGVTKDAVFTLETKQDIRAVNGVHGVTPPFSDRWFVKVDLGVFRGKELTDLIKSSDTCVFFCTCSKYSVYKKTKELLKDVEGVFDYYIKYLKRSDFLYIYDSFVTGDNKLTKKLFDYVVKSYSGDIEAVIDLCTALADGVKVESRKDISGICGIGGLFVESFIFSLTTPLSGSADGLKRVIRNRVQAGVDLCGTLGCSSMYNFMSSALTALCRLKTMMIAGVIYKDLRGVDDTGLERYGRYIYRLKEIPMSRLLRISCAMGDKAWKTELDFLNFIYRYYTHEVLEGGALIVSNS